MENKDIALNADRLQDAARELNAVSDELSSTVGEIDSFLQRLNLGMSVWVLVLPVPDCPWSSHPTDGRPRIGYAKISGRWGIALAADGEQWLFPDAPRKLRLNAIQAIPRFIEALLDASSGMVKRLEEANRLVRNLLPLVTQIERAAVVPGRKAKKPS